MKRRLRQLGVLAVAFLAGCSGISVNTPVEPGLSPGARVRPAVRVVFPGPAVSADPESVIRGFLRAGTASDGAYESAREFLSDAASSAWVPDATITILAPGESPRISALGGSTYRVTVDASATIDADGRYAVRRDQTPLSMDVRLVRVEGEWRIASLPTGFGRWIPSSEVPRLLTTQAVFYVASDRSGLVPDYRWFPLDRLAARLARAQLDVVPPYLLGTVTSAVPVGTRIAGDAVSVDRGLVTVNLLSPGLPTDATLRQNLWAQFVATLTQVPQITSVQLLADGVPVDLTDLPEAVSSPQDVGFPERTPPTLVPALKRKGGALVSLADGSGTPGTTAAGTAYPTIPADRSRVASSASGTELAALNGAGTELSRWSFGNRRDVKPFASSMSPPRFDRRGAIWVAGVSSGDSVTRIFVLPPTGAEGIDRVVPLDVTWLVGRLVEDLAVSAAGDRLAVVSTSRSGGDARLDITGVRRDAAGSVAGLGDRFRVGRHLERPSSVVWVGPSAVATVDVGATPAVPTIVDLAGPVHRLAGVTGGERVSTLGGERSLVVRSGKGAMWLRTAGQWASLGSADELVVAAT